MHLPQYSHGDLIFEVANLINPLRSSKFTNLELYFMEIFSHKDYRGVTYDRKLFIKIDQLLLSIFNFTFICE